MNSCSMSLLTKNQKSVVGSDEFKSINETANASVKDNMCRFDDNTDQSNSANEFSDFTSPADAERYPENHSDTFTIPIFEQEESEIIQRNLFYNCEQTHEECTLPETENNLVSLLGLSYVVSPKITLQHAISETCLVHRNMIKKTDLPWVTLQYILKHNLQWRDSVLPSLQQPKTEQPEANSMQLLRIGNIQSTERFSDIAYQCVVHPVDVFVTIFSCCSHDLKIIICKKLSMCKQAIPLIYRMSGRGKPCFTALPLYSLAMEYRTSENEADVIDAASAETKIIGFLRIGEVSQSKSCLLNGVLNADKHSSFCHRDSLLSQTQSPCMDGLVEATWFLPSGKKNDFFKDVITFLNLRGDAQNIKLELAAVSSMCSTIVALVDVSNLTDKKIIKILVQMKQSTNIVVLGLIKNSDKYAYNKLIKAVESLPDTMQSLPILVNFDQKGNVKSTAIWLDEIRKTLALASNDDIKKQLIKCGRALCEQGLVVLDESLTSKCTKGQMMARHLFLKLCGPDAKQEDTEHVEDLPFASMHDASFPLQGKVWKNLSDLTKKQFKAGDPYDYKDRVKVQLENTRRDQLKLCNEPSPAFATFLKYLRIFSRDDELWESFILWLKIILDANSRKSLPGVFRNLRTDVMENGEIKDETSDNGSIRDDEKTLTTLKLEYASFGLEHFIRELGQLYECVMVSKQKCGYKTLNGIRMIPKMVAKLLLKGEALEILDGNTANVPLQWIQSVFRCLEDDLGNRKLFIVSVLGLQSSGKSTLLNAMFGLQFKVSAGRCTKGAYAHLVCIENQNEIPYDYMLVIDTEGLLGQGREKNNHDNELATFVIGMGDVTLINVKGENTTELRDVLQIAVHAFLRMNLTNRNIKIKRKCIFIHQNVGDVHAKEKLSQNLKAFLDDLDYMTQSAAREENIDDVDRFNQVVDFRLQEHVLYFPDLWSGDPPMAPCNSGYSERVFKALEILHDTAKKMDSFITVTDLGRRIEDIWKGIMSEDFVFCFRNSLEIKVYNSMEAEYHKHAGCFGMALLDWIETASYQLEECETTKTFEECHQNLQQKLEIFVTKLIEETKNNLINYFDTSEMHLTLEQWKNQRILKFEEMAHELHTDLQKQLFLEVKEKKLEMLLINNQIAIMDKAKQLAADLQGNQPTDEIEALFDREWPHWIEEMVKFCLPISKEPIEPIESTVYNCLLNRVPKDKLHLLPEETSLRKKLSTRLDCLYSSWDDTGLDMSDFKGKIHLKTSKKKVLHEHKISFLFRNLEVHFQHLLDKGIQFHNQHATQVIDIVLEYFQNIEKNLKCAVPKQYQLKVVVHVCQFAVSKFTQMNIIYQRKHSGIAKIERYKTTAKHYFINIVKQELVEIVAADLFRNCLKSSAIRTLKVSLPQKITLEIFALFGNLKQTVLLTMMMDLVQKRKFELYSAYFNDPFTFTYSWIKNYVNECIFKDSKGEQQDSKGEQLSNYMEFVAERLNPIIHGIEECIDKATKHVMKAADTKKSIKDWLIFFQDHTRPYLKSFPNTYDQVAVQDEVDIRNFQRKALDDLISLREEIFEDFHKNDFFTFCGKGGVDYEKIFKTLWGCDEQCPFCGEPCYRSDGHLKENIKHSCIQHRPLGLSGTIYDETNKSLILESCSFQVQAPAAKFTCMACADRCKFSKNCPPGSNESHMFKDYQKYFPDWEIAPCTTMEDSVYWVWFFKTFKTDLAKEHNARVPRIPDSLISMTYEEAVMSVEDIEPYHQCEPGKQKKV